MKNVIKNIIERVHVCGADRTQLEVVIWSISYITHNWNGWKTIDERYVYMYIILKHYLKTKQNFFHDTRYKFHGEIWSSRRTL